MLSPSPSGRSTPVRPLSTLNPLGYSPRTQGSDAGHTSVQVVVRIRPQTNADLATVPIKFQRTAVQATHGSTTSLSVDATAAAGQTSSILASPPTPVRSRREHFSFDRVFSPADGQEDVFQTIEPLIESFIEGYNVSILAYGQTSSGKSYTMGTDQVHPEELAVDSDRLGIIPRAVSIIFEKLAQVQRTSRGGMSYQAKNSYIELYNEDLIDLLAGDVTTVDRPMVTIREDRNGNIIWTGLREVKVATAADVMANLDMGSAVRQTNSTDMNSQSSRSHAIFSLVLTQRKWAGMGPPPSSPSSPLQSRFSATRLSVQAPASPKMGDRPSTPNSTPGRPASRIATRPGSALGIQAPVSGSDDAGEWVTVTSKLNFVDLAGSERLKRTAAIGERVKEGIAINSGLHALGNVISALGDPAKARHIMHVPYRDSRLTRLLQDSLGGNARTLMVACVSPTEMNVVETLNTLKYANRARNIKNRAELNEVEVGWDDLEYLQNLVLKLRTELAALRGSEHNMGAVKADENRSIRDLAPRKDILDLQQRYSDLAAKHAKVTADLAKGHAARNDEQARSSWSAANFEAMVGPVVEEYEKTLASVESQLALTKAALAHSDETIRECEEQTSNARSTNDANLAVIEELHSRVSKLAERETTAEAHIRDLEARLEASINLDQGSNEAVVELRKECMRYKEEQLNAERYIKTLEARLAADGENLANLQDQIRTLERDARRRDEAYSALEQRISTLDTSADHRILLRELDERESRVAQLERALDEARADSAVAERKSNRASNLFAVEAASRSELEGKVVALEAEVTKARAVKPTPGTPASSAVANVSDLPAATTTYAADEIASRLRDLEHVHAKTQADLQSITRKYTEAMQELEALVKQKQNARLQEPGRFTASAPTSPTPSPLEAGPPHMSRQQSDLSFSRPSSRSSQVSPTRMRRSSTQGGSGKVPLFSRPPNQAAFGGHFHTRSTSLSSSEQLQLRIMPPPGTQGPTFTSSSVPTIRDRRNSLAGMHTERSYESLSAEIRQLQGFLADREKEIKILERRLLGNEEDVETLTSPFGVESRSQDTSATNVDMSQNALQVLDELKLALHARPFSEEEGETEQTARVNGIMRIMANKEADYRDTINGLQESIKTLKRQHESLEVLSRDQLRRSSNELEQLRTELHRKEQEASLLRSELQIALDITSPEIRVREAEDGCDDARQLIRNESTEQHHKDRNNEIALELMLSTMEDEHKQLVSRLRQEHLNQISVMQKDANERLQAALNERQRALHRSEEDRKSAFEELERRHLAALRQKEVELRAVQKELELRTNLTTQATQAETALVLDELKDAQDATLERHRKEHPSAIVTLQAIHAPTTASQEREAAALMQSAETDAADHLREMHVIEHRHREEMRLLREENAEGLRSLNAIHSHALSDVENKHQEELYKSALQDTASKEALNNLTKEHASALASLESQRQELLAKKTQLDEALAELGAFKQEGDRLSILHAEQVQQETMLLQKEAKDAREALASAMEHQRITEERMEQATENHAAELTRLHNDLTEAVAELQRRSVSGISDDPGSELQEAVDALVTLETALQESQDERERLLTELSVLQKNGNTDGSSGSDLRELDSQLALREAQNKLAQLQAEHQKVIMERDRQASLINDLQARDSPAPRGSSIDSTGSELEYVDAPPIPLGSLAASPAPSISSRAPPPTPPPNLPVPPLPSTAGPGGIHAFPSTSVPPLARATSSSTTRSSEAGFQTDSHPAISNSPPQDAAADSRVQRKMEEQEAIISRLSKQLNHCELDLRSNADLVTTLENALSDSERSVRKARLQMNDLAKERDALQRENDELRTQVEETSQQAESVRRSYMASQRQSEERAVAERQARDVAKDQLDRRMEDMRNRKSKFACF